MATHTAVPYDAALETPASERWGGRLKHTSELTAIGSRRPTFFLEVP